MRPTAVAIGLLTLVAAVASAQTRDATSGDEAAIAKVRSEYQRAADANDAAALARLFTPDAVEMPPFVPAQKGRTAIEAFHKEQFTAAKVSNTVITPTETRVLGDMAIDVGTSSTQVTPTGGKPFEDRGKYVVILKKSGGTWLISHLIYNGDAPPPMMSMPMKK